jgi:hypothetical protein
MSNEKNIDNTNSQVISKDRVTNHGEVFTAHKEVNAMLDLVKQETENIDSRFLEPACGTGNFLVEILRRKLAIVEKRYSKSQIEYERYSIAALFSIYGIELLPENAATCRERLFGIFTHHYASLFKKGKSNYLITAEFILSKNILCGDALSLKTPDKKHPIVFSEWAFVKGSLVKRRDFVFKELIPDEKSDLFASQIIEETGKHDFNPVPIKDYPLTHYLELAYAV